MTRVLFIRFSSIGDVVLTAPAVAAFRAAVYGPCEIHFLVRAAFAPVVEGFGPLVDVIHTVERTGSEALPVLRAANLHHVIDLQSNVRSRAVVRGLDLPTFQVDKQNRAKLALTLGLRRQSITPIVERYVEAFSGAFSEVVMPIDWPVLFTEAVVPADFDASTPWSVIALGAAHPFKAMPAELVQSVIDATPDRVILIGGPAEQDFANALTGTESWVGKTSLAESAALIRGARAVLAGDTGMMHLAAALGTRVVTVWGCTRPSLGMAAWRPVAGSVDVLPEGRGDQRPCSKLGDSCRYKRDEGCANFVSLEEVLDAWLT